MAVLCSYKATQNNITPGYLAPPTQMNPPPPASIELNAIYHYCRSILVDYPFQTGVENLKLMFEKSSKRSAAARQSNTMMHQGNSSYDEYDRRMPQQGPYPPSSYYPAQQYHSGGPHGKKPKSHPENPSNLSEFLSLFLSLMSDIFTLSLSELSLSTMLLSCTTESEFKEELVVEHQKLIQRVSNTMGSLLPKILDEFELLFSNLTSQLSAEVLIRILTISLFSIHFTRHELKRKFKQTTITATTTTLMNSTTFFAELQENRFVTESFAISCLFSLVSR